MGIRIEKDFFNDFQNVVKQLKTVNPRYSELKFTLLDRIDHFILIAEQPHDLLETYIYDICKAPQLFLGVEPF